MVGVVGVVGVGRAGWGDRGGRGYWVGGVGLVKKLTVTQKAKRKSGRGKKRTTRPVRLVKTLSK